MLTECIVRENECVKVVFAVDNRLNKGNHKKEVSQGLTQKRNIYATM